MASIYQVLTESCKCARFRNNTSVSKCADRGSRGAGRLSHVAAQSQITKSIMHPAAASQSKLCELGSLVLTSMVRDHGQREKRVVERRRRSAHQPPRCSSGWHGRAEPARPARGCLGKSSPSPHREHHNLTLQPASTRRHKHLSKLSWLSKPCTARHRIRGARRRQFPRGEITQISSERRWPTILLGGASRWCWGE
jgi:hypothetical protein